MAEPSEVCKRNDIALIRAPAGSREALSLKKELFRRRLIVTDRRGTGVSYVVKRPLPDGTRPFFVVIRHHAKKSTGRGQGLAAAAPA